MTYQIEASNGRTTGITAETEQQAIDTWAAGREVQITREGSLVTIRATVNGQVVEKAYVKAATPAVVADETPRATERQINYIRSLASKSAARSIVPADLSKLTTNQASRLIATLQDTYYA